MRASLGLAVLLAACVHLPAGPPGVDLLVVAPHPDDEVLMAGDWLHRAVQAGQRVAVIVVTNGDYTCERNGFVRQAETVAALASLGVKEDDVHFLGYPDGAVDKLSPTPLAPMERALPDGTCTRAAGTYATQGAGHVEAHLRRTGQHAPWTSTALTEDLAALLDELRPSDVVVPHGLDAHPDHAATYAYFRRALERSHLRRLTAHRAVVHLRDDCWPSDCAQASYTPQLGFGPLPAPLERYRPAERHPADAALKFEVLSRYPSQTGPVPRQSWLASFARTEETFFPETLVRAESRWERSPVATTQSQPLAEGVTKVPGEPLEVELTADRLVLRTLGQTLLGKWVRTTPGAYSLRLERRADDGGALECSLFGPEGLVGQRVVMSPTPR